MIGTTNWAMPPPPPTINTSEIIFEIETIQYELCGGDGRVMDCLRWLNELKQRLRGARITCDDEAHRMVMEIMDRSEK